VAGLGKGLMGAGMSYARGDVGGMIKGLMSTFKEATGSSGAEQVTKETRSSGADVVSSPARRALCNRGMWQR
jgi:hypothetical protein